MRPANLLITCSISVLVLTASVVPAVASDKIRGRTFEPKIGESIVASGEVQRRGFSDVGAVISAFAKPTPEALNVAGKSGLRLVPLGQSLSGPDGSFEVSGDLLGLASTYRGAQGRVDILLTVNDALASMSWNYTLFPAGSAAALGMRAPEIGKPAPTSGRYGDGGYAPATHIDLGSGGIWDVGNDPAGWLDGRGSPLGEKAHSDPALSGGLGAPDAALTAFAREYLGADGATRKRLLATGTHGSLDGQSTKRTIGCGVAVWLNSYKTNVKEHYLNVYSFTQAQATVEEGTNGSMSATLGVAIIGSGSSLSVGGTVGKTWGLDVSQSGIADATVNNRINYREQTISCLAFGGHTWQPYSTYDLLTDFSYAPHINYSTCSARLAGTAWSTNTASNSTWSTGVSFPGIDLSAQSGYGVSQKITFNFTAKGSICGNSTQGPTASSQVSARP